MIRFNSIISSACAVLVELKVVCDRVGKYGCLELRTAQSLSAKRLTYGCRIVPGHGERLMEIILRRVNAGP